MPTDTPWVRRKQIMDPSIAKRIFDVRKSFFGPENRLLRTVYQTGEEIATGNRQSIAIFINIPPFPMEFSPGFCYNTGDPHAALNAPA